ncbi:unnamed protein product [Gongylonema pulchrum]|uniref:Uncharacterized protein n=1 Tax=Gongylonema pulchrum TaxID=637853 RepID=A0A3P7RXK3_9BILA|nr:unnamed protein product [Gongylonema pulchrum]
MSLYDVNDSLCKITEPELSDTELETLLRACSSAREVYWLLQVLVRKIEVRIFCCVLYWTNGTLEH